MTPSPQALAFVDRLERELGPERERLLRVREERKGSVPRFVAAPEEFTVAPAPADLEDRRVEITGPVDRKMMINALNSGARVFMADFEDANSPTWRNVVDGQQNVYDAVRGTIELETPGRHYRLNDETATLVIRNRGWHLVERHHELDGKPVSASLFDFGSTVFANAREQLERGTGPYFYLPKLESHEEARLWARAFAIAEDELGLPHGSIKCTVLIETILAAFEMDAILYELRDHSCALNAGRWDYIFSCIKRMGAVLPGPGAGDDDRAVHARVHRAARPHVPCARSARDRRNGGVHPVAPRRRGEPGRAREGGRGQAPGGRRRLRRHMGRAPRPCRDRAGGVRRGARLASQPAGAHARRRLGPGRALVDFDVPGGEITDDGLRVNVSVGVRYLDAWLAGVGAAAIDNLMEDAATAEISRAQVWSWVNAGRFDEGRVREEIASVEASDAAKEVFADVR